MRNSAHENKQGWQDGSVDKDTASWPDFDPQKPHTHEGGIALKSHVFILKKKNTQKMNKFFMYNGRIFAYNLCTFSHVF